MVEMRRMTRKMVTKEEQVHRIAITVTSNHEVVEQQQRALSGPDNAKQRGERRVDRRAPSGEDVSSGPDYTEESGGR